MTRSRSTAAWTFAITSIALFMVALDNLVVTTALPVIKADLGASLADLQWMVNAYTLTFAVLLITGAALGDRFGRQRVFVIGMGIFIGGSALAALAPSTEILILARAIQGVGGAIVTPLTLTILSAAVPPERRAVALGAWGGIAGLAIAIGPLVGGAIAEGLDWHWIFWLNVPIGLALIPLAARRLTETYGPEGRLDLGGLGLISGGLLALVWGVINGNDLGWTSPQVAGSIAAGVILLLAFVGWEARHAHPMLPLSFFRSRSFSASNVVSLLMYFGMFGSIFLLAQFFQVVQGYSPFQAGLRTLPWTGMPIIVAPIAGILADRIGGRPILFTGMALQAVALAWLAAVVTPTIAYEAMVVPFILAGIGMGLFFAPIANVVLSAVRPDQEGKASGATNTIREVGGVFGVAVLASIFSANGDYSTPAAYVAGLQPAIAVGAVVVGFGALAALVIPARAGARAQAIERAERGPGGGRRARRGRLAGSPSHRRTGRVRGTAVAYPAAMPSVVSHVRAADGTDLLVRHWPANEVEAGGAWAGRPWGSVLLVHGLGEHSGRYEHVGDQLTRGRPRGQCLRPPRHGRLGWPAWRRRALVAAPRRPRRAAGGRAGRGGRATGRAVRPLAGCHDRGRLPAERPPSSGSCGAQLTGPGLDAPGLEEVAGGCPVPRRADLLDPQRHRWRDPVA